MTTPFNLHTTLVDYFGICFNRAGDQVKITSIDLGADMPIEAIVSPDLNWSHQIVQHFTLTGKAYADDDVEDDEDLIGWDRDAYEALQSLSVAKS